MKKIKQLLHDVFKITGREFIPYTYENFYSLRRLKIIKNHNINLLFDVGAHNGLYGKELREDGYDGRLVSFEPLEKPYRELEKRVKTDPSWESEQIALGDAVGEEVINVSGHLTSSSILDISSAHVGACPSSKTVNTEKIKISTLDTIRDKYVHPDDRIYLKIDVQGYEKHVLNGAVQTLPEVRLLELELSLTEMYQNGPTMMEMLELMKNKGFRLVAIDPVFSDPVSGYLLQADGIFVNTNLVD